MAMEHQLERKVRYFFSSRYRGRADIRGTFSQLKDMGHLAVVGGMLRDLALFGNEGFSSDLDLVIDPWDIDFFEDAMFSKGAKKNRFGGYSLPSNRWQIDVWPLQKTWAHLAGHVSVSNFEDLTKTTFFNCDAVLYDIDAKRVICDSSYFDVLENRILDINLRPNPNPSGNAVRAFRYAFLKGFVWSRDLAIFVSDVIDDVGWTDLELNEVKSFGSCQLELINEVDFRHSIRSFISGNEFDSFDPTKSQKRRQLELPLTH